MINSSVWLQGAGRFGTTLKRKNSSSGSPMLLISSSGITLSDFAFDGNKGGPGIASPSDSVTADRPVSKLTIQRMRFANSTNSQQTPGSNAGFGLYLQPGGPNLAAISDVIIRGNHSYDDQAIQTQGYGIGIALAGQATGYSNIIIEGNDLTGNLHGGIQNNASPFTGFVIRNNPGQNPVGAITAPAFPSSGAGSQINNTGYDVTLYITSGTNPITIAINGTTLTGVSVAGGGAVSGPIRLPANQNITLTYAAGGTPSWQWIAD
jgi:hypothetical protein